MNKEIELSQEFKLNARKAVISIIIFIIVYALIFLFAIGLTISCGYGALGLVMLRPSLITLALGLGLGSLGLLVLFFLIKFMFKSNKTDKSNLTEITRKQHPKLFELIENLVNEVGTSFPKKVYLAPDVTAAVFYDSSFWSMFFPVKKNLLIGLGLVNATTESELKAVIAHEMGHFSQKTMKVGSYVHNLNQIIFNLLYDNDIYDASVRKFGESSGYFVIFVMIAIQITKGIQWLLKQLYNFLNKNYLGLSREMEFHADSIAAQITGYIPLKTSLLRLELAEVAFNNVLSFYDGKIVENIRSNNIYLEHHYLMSLIAEHDKVPLKNDLPDITLEEYTKYNKSKLNIENQWASHPSIEQRIERLETVNTLNKEENNNPASNLFHNINQLQESITQKIFGAITYSQQPTVNTLDKFKENMLKDFSEESFSERYNKFYDNKNPILFDIREDENEINFTFDELFSIEKVNKNYELLALKTDIETLKFINTKESEIKTFDYDGIKYKKKEAEQLLTNLDLELKEKIAQEKQHDINIFNFFHNNCKLEIDKLMLRNKYRDFFEYDKKFDKKTEISNEIIDKLQFVAENMPYDKIKSNFASIEPLEKILKEQIKEILKNPHYEYVITLEIKNDLENYLSKKWSYFGNQAYFDENLQLLFRAVSQYQYLVSRGYFLIKKQLLDFQIAIIN